MRVHGKEVWKTVKDKPVTVLAPNPKLELSIEPILAAGEKEDTVLAIELAKDESFDPCYTGITPSELNELTKKYAEKVGDPVYFLHQDHNTFGEEGATQEELEKAEEFRDQGIKNEYTSFSVDASCLELDENIEATKELARPIVEEGYGLEVEVGEVGGIEDVTDVGEALYFVESLIDEGIDPDLLAISNGSVHGHYEEGQRPHLHLRRTYDIATVVQSRSLTGVVQHGTTGTPNVIMEQFPEHEIKKANVGTNFQDIFIENMPENLKAKLEEWKNEQNKSSVKYAFSEYRSELANIGEKCKQKIYDETFRRTRELIRLFNSQGLAKKFR